LDINKSASENLDSALKRIGIYTKVLGLIETKQDFGEIVNEVLKIVLEYFGISNAFMYRSAEFDYTIFDECAVNEPLAEKIKDALVSVINENPNDLCVFPVANEMSEKEKRFLEENSLKAVLFMPLVVDSKPAMYLVLCEQSKEYSFGTPDVCFIADICKLLQNVLDNRIAKNSLISSLGSLKDILDNLGSGLYVVDPASGKILFANDVMKNIIGAEMYGRSYEEFHLGTYEAANEESINALGYYREVYDDERDIWFSVRNSKITWVDGRTVSVCNVTDITEKKKYEKRVEFQANNDFLTGLYNRMRCESDIEECVDNALGLSKNGYLFFIDLDDFKNINDGLGHQYGDMLLKLVSVGLQQIDGIEDRCYRVGGDEFIVIVEATQNAKFNSILKSVKGLFDNPFHLNGTEYYCKCSIGIVAFPEDGTDVNDLVKKADIAMYSAKKSGKNHYEFYNARDEKNAFKRLDIEKNMRSAIQIGCNEFEVYVQPIVDAKTMECIGGEALIRWNNTYLGFLAPGEFIPLAEHLGLITPIGNYFLRRCCEANKRWNDHGINKHLNVNLSVVQLMKNDILDQIKEIIIDTGVNPDNMVLEITENLAINDMNRVKKIIKELKSLGTHIALDDFGTGYSSLNYIKQLDFDIIKVDRSFISDIVADDYAQTFVKLITELSQKLQASVCVEGVELKEQYEMLKEMNVDLIQGFYFGKPMPIAAFEKKFLGLQTE